MAFTTEHENSASESSTKIRLKDVYKIFGEYPEDGLKLLRSGKGKADIHRETGCSIGVNSASFDIKAGEIFVIMGLSGSGKSTLLRLLNRLIEPTSGSIEIDGQDITKMSRKALIELRRRDISMVFQSFALLPNRNVVNNAAFGLEVAGVGEVERKAKAMAALEAVGLKGYCESRTDELSGGMKQRVGLARALASEPSILLMDEAFSALDPLIRTEMQDELVRLQSEQSRTIVFVSHDLDEAMRIGDRICIMQNGNVVQVGTPDEIVGNPANDYVRSFFRNVDVSQVFKAGDVARKNQITIIERQGVSAAAALEQMKSRDREFAIIVGRDMKYHGMVSQTSLMEKIRSKADDPYRKAFLADAAPIRASEQLSGVLGQVAASAWPVPVVDDQHRYVGAISKSVLLETLDRAN
ncbi:Glycine betaine/proline betaine transport system ATP-binding protein ProV [Ensifer sp. M14]|jgi:glycine betaine/proline transport system ATP-binding protein|uniref:glycine betaine/L-proline ABC transporter ATP-binding protein ProV n=1 Tax=Sinorhizobium/Ensifer group TaxID=227292 RepID=UPI00098620D9|nr:MULTISPECIES: glycine betaine/L-proline ABC transporter ATP-binding protein ProV [Sinorhizobium/Ensifer group]OOG65245.1 glycine betaine/L-proline ABC transporter ATP-binding protein [Sinorhizobium sp. A49]RDL46427.1 Glycine betaine/proline betaine transport system ATP-binding protein ProV [Ensifer sp. M14]